MAGHSKWKNIMHKKAKNDVQRAKIFTKIGKEISVAVKDGGPDPLVNSKLRDLITKAKAENVPNDNIERVIKKAAGGDGADYEEIIYEGYGIGGIAVIVKTMTDNRNRTASEMRHYFDKFGGNLGTTGCVSFMFEDKGVILVPVEDEERMMEDALECGAEDISIEDGFAEITTLPQTFGEVNAALEALGYKPESSKLDKIPSTCSSLDEEQAVKMRKMLDMFDDNEDVIEYWHNWDIPEED